MLFVRNDNPSKYLLLKSYKLKPFLVELNVGKKKGLANCFYHLENGNTESCLNAAYLNKA